MKYGLTILAAHTEEKRRHYIFEREDIFEADALAKKLADAETETYELQELPYRKLVTTGQGCIPTAKGIELDLSIFK